MTIVTWNGLDLPTQLRELPPGRYVIASIDEAPALTPEEEQGLLAAADALRAGQGHEHDDVRARIDEVLRR